MDFITLIGIIAGTLTTISFIPQVIHTYKTRSAKDVSLVMFTIFSIGILFWIVYGFFTHSIPIIIANLITFTLSIIMIIFKLKYEK